MDEDLFSTRKEKETNPAETLHEMLDTLSAVGWDLRPFLGKRPGEDTSLYTTEQVCQCVTQQVSLDIPSVEVKEVRPYQYHYSSGRWYVEVDLSYDKEVAIALYRVWVRDDGCLAALKVALVEREKGRE